MATTKPSYLTEVVATVTNLQSLPNGSWWASQAFNNETTDQAIDCILGGVFQMNASSAPTAGATVDVYVAARWGDSPNDFQASIGTGLPGEGTKTAGTNFMEENLILAETVVVPATTSAQVKWSAGSVAALFGGVMPPAWCVLVENNSGQALDSSGNDITYVPIQGSSA